jgi:hypothetical protein
MPLETRMNVETLPKKKLLRVIPVGERFGRLTVVRYLWHQNTSIVVLCHCDCGNDKPITLRSLESGNTASCGCIRLRHGDSRRGQRSQEYDIWSNMVRRCHDKTNPAYKNYGGRGIQVCSSWHDFATFLEYICSTIGRKPGAEYTLDRIDNDRGYEPGNIRWATRVEQIRNSRRVHLLSLHGVTASLAEWSQRLGIPYATIKWRLRRGWPVEKVLRVAGMVDG